MLEPAIKQVLLQRSQWGRGYPNRELETKRRSAVIWLRLCSRVGWWMDKI